ncbi:MAG: RlmE family RNA methyltransferase [Treponema sp.]|jgi:23S rRNA (uridine2552-2'-O)-methyltransferase|nr:RlmE family RNA methyltransferase [Treponema sp.]
MADYKKPDHWQLKARKEGYPARSIYKLKEIDEKFSILKPPRTFSLKVLDLGAAPGSWSLYVLRKMSGSASQKRGFLAAADLSPLSADFDSELKKCAFTNNDSSINGNFFFIQGDITDPQVRETLLSKGPYTTIISDAAPATTGNHTVDSARSLALAEEVISYAEALVPGGNLAVKVFQGGDSAALLKHMKTLFQTAKSFKPQACRGESVETYYIGLGKK